MQLAWAVDHGILVFLQKQDPACKLTRGRLLALEQPHQGAVIDHQLEGAAEDVAAELVEAVHDREALELGDGVVALSRLEAARGEGDRAPFSSAAHGEELHEAAGDRAHGGVGLYAKGSVRSRVRQEEAGLVERVDDAAERSLVLSRPGPHSALFAQGEKWGAEEGEVGDVAHVIAR